MSEKPSVEYDIDKGIMTGPYGAVIIWPVSKDEATDHDWLVTSPVTNWDKETNHIETRDFLYIPQQKDEDMDLFI